MCKVRNEVTAISQSLTEATQSPNFAKVSANFEKATTNFYQATLVKDSPSILQLLSEGDDVTIN